MSYRSTGRAAVVIAIAALATAALSACSNEPTEAVQIGDLPADTGPAIDLEVPLDEWDTFEEWPSACDLVTDETLQALLPQTTSIARAPESVSYEFQGTDLIPISGGITVPEALCDVTLDVPVGMLENNVVTLNLEVLMAGSPEMVELNTDPNIESGTPLDLAGGTCTDTTAGISCVNESGQVAFRVTFTLPHHGPSLKDPSRYVHDGEEVSFTTNAEDDAGRYAYINENLAFPIVESILARLEG